MRLGSVGFQRSHSSNSVRRHLLVAHLFLSLQASMPWLVALTAVGQSLSLSAEWHWDPGMAPSPGGWPIVSRGKKW